jgi:hypothetical protein
MSEARCSGFLLLNQCIRKAKLIRKDFPAITRDIGVPEEGCFHFECSILYQSSEIEQRLISATCVLLRKQECPRFPGKIFHPVMFLATAPAAEKKCGLKYAPTWIAELILRRSRLYKQ